MNKAHRLFTDFEALQKEAPKQIDNYVYVGKGCEENPLINQFKEIYDKKVLGKKFPPRYWFLYISDDGWVEDVFLGDGSNPTFHYYLHKNRYDILKKEYDKQEKIKMPEKFEIGDIVALKSGSFFMTINNITDKGKAHCVYEHNYQIVEIVLDLQALKK